MNYTYIDNDAALAEFCSRVEHDRYCALDTEFVREKTYFPLLALVQIATESAQACIDPFKISDFSPFTALLRNTNMVKILHSPSQDLELFQHTMDALPTPVFDTQIAAAVLGYANQIGYADLVQRCCNVTLEKKYTRTDWSRRPLSEGELDYAMDDVRYLIEIHDQLKTQLEKQGRLEWVQADFDRLSDPAEYQIDISGLWKRLKGVNRLKGLALNNADQLCQWREQRAIDKNRPRRWIMKDEDIVDIARLKPKSLKELGQIGQLSAEYMKKIGDELLEVLNRSAQMETSAYPRHDDFSRLDNNQQAQSDALMSICRMLTEQQNIAMASVLSKKDLDQLVSGRRDGKIMQGWRYQMLGRHLEAFLSGNAKLAVTGGKLVIEE